MANKILQSRRKKVEKKLKKNELMIVFAASVSRYPRNYLEDKNFLYLTGMELPNGIYLQGKGKQKSLEHIFIERENPKMVVWEGKKPSTKDVQKQSGVKLVSNLDEFQKTVSAYLNNVETCYVDFGSAISSPLSKAEVFIKQVRDRFPNIQFKKLDQFIAPLRSVKTAWEIEQIQKAIDVTAIGIEKMRNKARVGMMEYELEAILRFEITSRGFRHIGFKPIIASGVNAATLHYDKNNCKIKKNDLILTDVGAAANGYSADITRTFPVSDKFTKRQKEVYTAVLDTNKAIIEMIEPGVEMKKLNERTVELLSEAMLKLGLIEDTKEYRKYYMHSVGHHLGLDTHDLLPENNVMKAGYVITVEPGIYIPEEKIGVRIEDDILVTKDGHKNLSEKIPKEIEDLEKK